MHASDKKTGEADSSFCHKPETVRLAEASVEPLSQMAVSIRPQLHVRSAKVLAVIKPGSPDRMQVITGPFADIYFHCEFHNNLR
jgi:hypothetical protein